MFQVKWNTLRIVVVLLITIFTYACGDIIGGNSMEDWSARWMWSNTDGVILIIEFKRNGTYGWATQNYFGQTSKLQMMGTYSITGNTFQLEMYMSKQTKRASRGTWIMHDDKFVLELHFENGNIQILYRFD